MKHSVTLLTKRASIRSGSRIVLVIGAVLSLYLTGSVSGESDALTAQRYKEMADEYRVQKQKLAAVEAYKKSLQKNPNYVPALISMGTLMREFGSYNESREYLLKAYSLSGASLESTGELIVTEMERGDVKSAEDILRKGMEKFPQEPDFEYLQARIYITRNQFYLAEKKLNQVIKNNPAHIKSLLALGDLNLNEKKYRQARAAFERARLINSENPDVFIGLFLVSFYSVLDQEETNFPESTLSRNQFRDSIEYLMTALEYDEDYVPANLMLGKIFTAFGDCAKAGGYLERVMRVSPDHSVARYYRGICFPENSLEEYRYLLERNQNNEVLRYAYERNLARYSSRRENQKLLEMAREHYHFGKNLFKSHMTHHGVFEMNWAAYLYPSFVDVHKELYQYYRNKKDYVKMADELNFLRNSTSEVLYQDLYEMLVDKRKEKLYYQEKIYRPEEKKTPTPLYVFHFKPEDFLGNIPDAGEAIAEKLYFALGETGRVRILTGSQKSQLVSALAPEKKKASGVSYSPSNGKRVLAFLRQTFTSESGYDPDFVRYAVTGSYREIPEGLDVNAEIIDLETGITMAPFHTKSSGRGYLRDIVTKLADHIYKNIPFQGQIVKISSNGVIVNMGEREGIATDSVIGVYRDGKKFLNLDVSILDTDILWAKPQKFSDIYRLQPGDKVRLEPKNDNKEAVR